jgi:hypothetical protein
MDVAADPGSLFLRDHRDGGAWRGSSASAVMKEKEKIRRVHYAVDEVNCIEQT